MVLILQSAIIKNMNKKEEKMDRNLYKTQYNLYVYPDDMVKFKAVIAEYDFTVADLFRCVVNSFDKLPLKSIKRGPK